MVGEAGVETQKPIRIPAHNYPHTISAWVSVEGSRLWTTAHMNLQLNNTVYQTLKGRTDCLELSYRTGGVLCSLLFNYGLFSVPNKNPH